MTFTGIRSALLISAARFCSSRSSAIPYLTGITVAQITTTIRDMASEVVLTPGEDGMFAECVVNADSIQTIQKDQLSDLITELSPERMREVRVAIEFALGFDALT